jgi:TPR repeat protein
MSKPVTPVPGGPRPAASKPSPALASPADTFEDRLVADGEKYLYGRGVPEDCTRAQRNLQIGARQSNPKAQTLLGAMYATGHCVNRDLPTAYRWFAKALHGDPGNSRVQRDLEVLWKQMTPEERQLAMKSQ